MAFLKDYEYDIFISYAHVDNTPFPGQTAGWIEQFYKNLDLMLAKRFGRPGIIKIWWDDKRLDGSVVFNKSIEAGIKSSAIMMCLNSPGYIASDYCKKELDTFYKKAKAEKTGLVIGARSRIINVLLNNIPFGEWLPELSGTSGFPFHDATEADDFGDALETNSHEFSEQLKNVRDALWNILNDFSKTLTPSPIAPIPTSEGESQKFSIFFGEVADTLRIPRKRAINELEKLGFNIIFGIPPPNEVNAHEQAIKDALNSADMAVHLLDEYPGREIVGAPELWYPQKQAELAMQTGKSQLIWVPAETDFQDIEDDNYKLFLQKLETGESISKNFEFVRGSKSNLAMEIIDIAEHLKAQRTLQNAENEKISVLLDTHFKDQLYALDLSRTLIENKIQPFINPQEDDPHKNINILADRISQVRKLIFLYGSVSKEWVFERMSAALHLIITNNFNIDDFFIFMAPPHKEKNSIQLNQRFLKISVIDNSDNPVLDKEKVDKLLTELRMVAV